MTDKEKREKVFDILNKFEFFQGSRAGRELWLDKPKEVQDKDIDNFVRDVDYIRNYLINSVVLSQDKYNRLRQDSVLFKELIKRIRIATQCKETAEKILNELYCTPKEQVENKIKELAKFIGVEIKE